MSDHRSSSPLRRAALRDRRFNLPACGDDAPLRALQAAIVLQALDDYCAAVLALRANRRDGAARARLAELNRFFDSDWYRQLCPLPSRLLRVNALREYQRSGALYDG